MPKSLVFLVGYRGSGKTTAAHLLAQRLGWSFIDADVALEKKLGRSIQKIFAEEGEEGFRTREAANLAELCRNQKAVVATGGGVVLRPENRERLRTGFVVWLTAAAETLHERIEKDVTTKDRRPPLAQGGLEEVRDIVKKRELLYAQCSDLVVDTGKMTTAQVVDAICSIEQFQKEIAKV